MHLLEKSKELPPKLIGKRQTLSVMRCVLQAPLLQQLDLISHRRSGLSFSDRSRGGALVELAVAGHVVAAAVGIVGQPPDSLFKIPLQILHPPLGFPSFVRHSLLEIGLELSQQTLHRGGASFTGLVRRGRTVMAVVDTTTAMTASVTSLGGLLVKLAVAGHVVVVVVGSHLLMVCELVIGY